jgi:4-hydroxybenzoate polyprenyltransferase
MADPDIQHVWSINLGERAAFCQLNGQRLIPPSPIDGRRAFGDAATMEQSLAHSHRDVLRGYLVLPHAVPVIVVLAATAAFGLVAASGWPGLIPMLRLLGAMLGAQLAIGAVNELADADLDAIAKPDKPIPAGLVSRGGAGIVAGCGIGMMAALSLTFGVASFLLCTTGTLVGIAYSLWFKRSIWSWVPYLIALPLLPIWVWTALDTLPVGLLAIYPIGAAAIIAVQIAQSLPDVTVDQETNVRTLATVLGPNLARNVCWIALLVAVGLAAICAPWLTDRPGFVWLAGLIAVGLIGVNVAIWSRDARRGVLAAFPCVACAAVILGLGWAAALAAG